jgi:hypothetical protein
MIDEIERESIWKEAIVAWLRYYPRIYLERLKKASVRIRLVLAKIRSEHLPNRDLERYRYASLLSSIFIV